RRGMDQQKNTVLGANQTFTQEIKMNLLIYLIVAAVIGWVATEIMHDRSNLLINIIVAVLGAFLAGYFLTPIFHVGTINDAITIPTMLVTLLGAIILLAIVHLFTHR
ncbi:MAG: GlsB/YeaQ/YmgE family stress response membrane protein, partial [Dehalococcoidales bacterium]|nr:GlsB/YeaQ/YmgE family stress response membrane protein [Dehalococcoidales bacterium]